jgi:hypothetical protein
MSRKTILFWAIMTILLASLILVLFQGLRLAGGAISSTEAMAVLPLIVQGDVSFIAFWGIILVFRIEGMSSQRIELMKNLWDIGFKRDEVRMKLTEIGQSEESKAILTKLNEDLGEDAAARKEAIEFLHEWEDSVTIYGLIAVLFFALSIAFGVYGIGATFHAERLDPLTYFTPMVCLFGGIVSTIFSLLSTSVRIKKSLEIR